MAIHNQTTAVEKATKKVGELSNEIYKLNEAETKLESLTDSFEELDNKIIKTKEDLEEMNNILDSAAETIDFTRGGKVKDKVAEQNKELYKSLDAQGKIEYIEQEQLRINEELTRARAEQLKILNDLSEADRTQALKDANNLAAVRAINNAELYDSIDELGKLQNKYDEEELQAAEDLGQRILSNLEAGEAFNLATRHGAKEFAKQIADLGKMEVINTQGESATKSLAEILTSTDYKFSDQIEAYRQAYSKLDSVSKEAFKDAYNALSIFAE